MKNLFIALMLCFTSISANAYEYGQNPNLQYTGHKLMACRAVMRDTSYFVNDKWQPGAEFKWSVVYVIDTSPESFLTYNEDDQMALFSGPMQRKESVLMSKDPVNDITFLRGTGVEEGTYSVVTNQYVMSIDCRKNSQ